MNINRVSFYQQNQAYWQNGRAHSQAAAAEASLINVMGNAMLSLSKGKSSIANGQALKRVNSTLLAAVQNLLNPGSAPSTTGSTSSAKATAATKPIPATATGTARLTTATSLATLGILAGSTFSVTAGTNTTTYTSTGTDTVGSLISALNIDLPTNAHVTASLNNSGKLVITGRNTKDMIVIDGSGITGKALGFGLGTMTFKPVKGTPATGGTATASSSASTSSAGTSSGSTASSRTSAGIPATPSPLVQTSGTAASVLSASGASGSLVNMLT